MKPIHALARLAVFTLMFIGRPANAVELNVGDVAPSFKLIDQNNKPHVLEDYQHHWLVLYFYPKDDTPGCTTEACNFRDDYYKLKALKAVVIGVSLDDSDSHEAFATKYQLPFPLLADTTGDVSRAYGALWKMGPIKFSKRYTFIINPEGRVKKIYRDVEPEQHSTQIINDLKQLLGDV